MITNEVAVTITIAQHDDGSIYAGLYDAEVPADDVMPILEVAGALTAAAAVQVLLNAFGFNAALDRATEGGNK